MIRVILILDVIIRFLVLPADKFYTVSVDIVSFLDQAYPQKLKCYFIQIPIIYYKGDISLLTNFAFIIHSISPSYYAQSVIYQLRKKYCLIGLVNLEQSISLRLYKYDIIYCNDITLSNNENSKLGFYIGFGLKEINILQVLNILASECYVLEGCPSSQVFNFLSDCCDNETNVYALPTNIFSSTGILPNLLLDNGVMPLLLKR